MLFADQFRKVLPETITEIVRASDIDPETVAAGDRINSRALRDLFFGTPDHKVFHFFFFSKKRLSRYSDISRSMYTFGVPTAARPISTAISCVFFPRLNVIIRVS